MVRHRSPPTGLQPFDPEIALTTGQDFFTIDRFAALVRVHERTVRRWIKAGRLPCLVIGGTRRIPVAALRGLITGSASDADNHAIKDNVLDSTSEDTLM